MSCGSLASYSASETILKPGRAPRKLNGTWREPLLWTPPPFCSVKIQALSPASFRTPSVPYLGTHITVTTAKQTRPAMAAMGVQNWQMSHSLQYNVDSQRIQLTCCLC